MHGTTVSGRRIRQFSMTQVASKYRERGFVLLSVVIVLLFIAAAAFVAGRQRGMLAADIGNELDRAKATYLARAAMAHATWKANKANCNGTYPSVTGSISGQGSYAATVTKAATSPANISIAVTGTSDRGGVVNLSRTGIRPHYTTITTTTGNIQADTTISGNAGQTTTNYGNAGLLTLNLNQKILMSFGNNIYSGLLNNLIVSEILTLQQTKAGSTTPVTLNVYPMTKAWTEPGVSWTYANGTATPPVPWAAAGGDYDAMPIAQAQLPVTNTAAITIDLTPAAEAWKSNDVPFISNGIALVPAVTTLNNANIYSSEAIKSTTWPTIVVKSMAPCP